jgi:hypothetical protein
MVSTNKQAEKERIIIYKLAKVNKIQTHAKLLRLLLFLTVNLLAQAEKPTRIYLVRHAEKIKAI